MTNPIGFADVDLTDGTFYARPYLRDAYRWMRRQPVNMAFTPKRQPSTSIGW